MVFDAAFVAKIQEAIDKGFATGAHRSAYLEVMEALDARSIPYKSVVHASATLVHPCNRGGTGLNAHDAHANAALYIKLGFDFNELKNATSFELSPDTEQREKQVGFNKKLASCANGLLAPVSGQERVLTVGCGHTAAFFKAAHAGCVTNAASLKDDRGNLNSEQLATRSPQLKKALLEGWSHTILPWRVEQTWPRLPALFEKALNATNQANTAESEFAIMTQILHEATARSKKGDTVDWNACARAAIASEPPCAAYVDILAKYVQQFAGGVDAPLLIEIDDFQKAHAAQRSLGPTFISAVAGLDFGMHKGAQFRTALLKTQLTAKTIEHGVCKMLQPKDITSVKKNSMIEANMRMPSIGLSMVWGTSLCIGLFVTRCVRARPRT